MISQENEEPVRENFITEPIDTLCYQTKQIHFGGVKLYIIARCESAFRKGRGNFKGNNFITGFN